MSRHPNLTTSTGIPRVLPSRSTFFDVSATQTKRSAAATMIFSRRSAPATALEQAEVRVDLVGAVERERQPQGAVELDDLEPGDPRVVVGLHRAHDDAQRPELVEPPAELGRHGPHRAPGPQPDRAAGLD